MAEITITTMPDNAEGGMEIGIEWISRSRKTLDRLKTMIGQARQVGEAPEGLHDAIALALLELRECNRNVSAALRSRKKRAQQAKNAFDRAELVRQNLLYQRSHVQATINEVRRHAKLYLTIPLHDEAYFEAHTMTQHQSISEDPHQKMLARLSFELEQRMRLAEALKAGQDKLELCKSRLVLKKKELERVHDLLAGIVKSAEPFLTSCAKYMTDLHGRSGEGALSMKAAAVTAATTKGDGGERGPLENLYEALCKYCTLSGNCKTYYYPMALLEGQAEEEEEEEEGSITMDIDNDASKTSKAHGHARFISQAHMQERRFEFEHVMLAVTLSDANHPDQDGRHKEGRQAPPSCILLYFYHAVPTNRATPLVVTVEMGEGEDGNDQEGWSKGERESLLLSCQLEPHLLLTLPHESIVIGEAGHVPFRWIQAAAGMLDDPSYVDVGTIIDSFLKALLKRHCQTVQKNTEEKATIIPMTIEQQQSQLIEKDDSAMIE